MLNAQQILDEGLLLLEHTQGKAAQVGYDLSLKSVNKIGPTSIGTASSKVGKVLKDKTELTTYTPYPVTKLDGVEGWMFYPGTYDITFHEGCKLPDNRVAFIKQRSSLYRNGAIINSPVFDPGFETQNMGTLMYVHETLFIEKNARVAQIYFHICDTADKYNGQWQNDIQRK
jgi:deoxycytidine triphosphate deaminase